jgi:hypothetical protein
MRFKRGTTAIDLESHREESYRILYPKIGRDFVDREDFINIIRQILSIVDPNGLHNINIEDDSFAILKAIEYKESIESGEINKASYIDLIDLDE